ncbi:MAG: ShlB/FhaC/HecB family hemolysin secretion/activation protein [Proteobacteria bacterium]|nr:ShlB/FhaC/HecB family hemolysin secretion/activation protein [Pseudomonadota bacterium]
MNRSASARHWLCLPAILLCSMLDLEATAQTGDFAAQELQRQQERERALREQQERTPDVRLPPAAPEAIERLPQSETPCFTIHSITLKSDAPQFDWALAAADPADDPASGRCLGSTGINLVMKRIQNAIVARGFVTTRVLAEAQDLQTGILSLTVIAGRIRAIRFSDDSDDRANAANALPARPGDLLNLRDIEQALENFKRVPTAEADIKIVPGEQAGDSDLVVTWKQSFPLRLTLSADDGGLQSTGKYLGSITVAADNPLGLNDLFYASLNHNLDGRGEHGTRGYTAHYSLPWGYWLLGATASANRYHQTVAGDRQNYDYSGTSDNYEIRLTRTLRRDAASRTWASLRAYFTESSNFIDDTEIEVQHRRMAGWEAALGQRTFIAKSTLNVKLAYRHGTGAFAALPAPEEAFGEGTARPIIVSAEAQLTAPFMLGEQRLRLTSDWRAQWNRTPLVPQDRFAIGGRYTVRGFDGESVLMAERGWLIRNDVGIALGESGHEIYAAVDYGEVGGQSAALLIGTRLTGAVIGARGSYRGLYYDVFAGRPLNKPQGFETADVTAGFNLTLSF